MVEIVSPQVKKEPPEVTQDRRGAWVQMMQDLLEANRAEQQFPGDFPTDLGNLHVMINRNQTSLAAVWGRGDETKRYEIDAASVVLAGQDDDEDEQALQLFLDIPGIERLPADKLADIRDRPRPSLGVVYFDPALYESGIAQLAVTGLALAYIGGRGAIVNR